MRLLDRARPQLRLWQRRFDARVLRERLMMTLAAVALCLMLADALWLGAALKSWQAATRRVQTAQKALDALQADGARQRANGDAQARQLQLDLSHWRQRVREGDTGLRSYEDSLVGPERMLDVLEQMLARHGQLRVRAMHSLGRSDLLDAAKPAPGMVPATSTAAAVAGAASAAAPGRNDSAATQAASLYRHGVELTLAGSFAELLSYLHTLEAMPQRLLWGGVELRVEQYPRSLLKLRLYTVSRDRHWLEI